ncbi:hypothetical protein LUZ60_005346 [Juncus effusus]|nr:hypothetical protein LUZ60_005346 [Juncus effusus]
MEKNGEDPDRRNNGGGMSQRVEIRGKHWIAAELKRLEQEARFLEKELEELDKAEKVSLLLQELLYKIEHQPDPLLPITNGPSSPSWDRWFEGPQQSRRCKCWII